MTNRLSAFDVDAYLDALPRNILGPPRPDAPTRYQVSRYPLLRSFNGFDGTERRRGGQLAGWLLAAGCLTLASHCNICGHRGPVGLHGENYYDVSRDPTLCRGCHKAIHMRFYRSDDWRRLVDASAVTGVEWFALIPEHSIDIAQHLRSRWGWQAADIERSPFASLPEPIAVKLPNAMVPHPRLSREPSVTGS